MLAPGVDPRVVESLGPELLKLIPAAYPPPGVKANFEHPYSIVPQILVIDTLFLAIALFCYTIRIYTKITISKKWRWDDLTITLGFILAIAYYANGILGCLYETYGKHAWDVHLIDILNDKGLLAAMLSGILATPSLGLIKCSLLIQYYNIFGTLRWVRITVLIGGTLAIIFYLTGTVLMLVWCTPHKDFSLPTGIISMLFDWYLLILPIPAVLALKMSAANKFGVLIVFMTGGVATIAACFNLYYRIKLQFHLQDQLYKSSFILIFTQIEQFSGVAAASMPSVKHFCTAKNISVGSWIPSLQSNFSSLRSKFSKESKSKSAYSSSASRVNITQHSSNESQIEKSGLTYTHEPVPAVKKVFPTQGTQIRVTREVFVIREPDVQSTSSSSSSPEQRSHEGWV